MPCLCPVGVCNKMSLFGQGETCIRTSTTSKQRTSLSFKGLGTDAEVERNLRLKGVC